MRPGSHSKTLEELPSIVLHMPALFSRDLGIILEVKDKEASCLRLYNKYFTKKHENDKLSWHLNSLYQKL